MCASIMVEDLCKDEGKVVATRVLLVEDHEPFRRFVRAALSEHPDFCLVDEACDGLQAVHKFQELEPDLVLMDIGLPGQNGLLAARKMLALAPACKIVFLTQEGSPEIVEEALKLGAAGYVMKAHAAGELLPAVLAARDGRLFTSTVMARSSQPVTARRSPGRKIRRAGDHDHPAHFHPNDTSLLSDFTGFAGDALKAGNAVIMLLTESHRPEFLQSLQACGVDIKLAVSSGRLVLLDVDETLEAFMVDDLPDPARFFQSAGEIVNAVKTANRDVRVVACGECAPTLWARGNGEAAVQLEQLWDRLVKMFDLETLCGYAVTSLQREQEKEIYQRICDAHSAICAL
jgi:DNA-binding NarL/FixJ family response regulator